MTYAYDSPFAKILGPLATLASLKTIGGDPAKWVDNFRANEPAFYSNAKAQGSRMWEVANYYDRAKIYYAMAAAEAPGSEKEAEYLNKGTELALNYRDTYAPDGGVSGHWSMPVGVALHHIVTGDAKSRDWIVKVATNFSATYYVDGLDNSTNEMDCRVQGRCLEAWSLAWLFTGDAKWANLLRPGLTDILSTQDPSGGYLYNTITQHGQNKPFMVGLLNDAMLLYQRLFETDDRIPPSIRKACEYMWSINWIPAEKCFQYSPGEGDSSGYPDLNMLIVDGFTASGMANADIINGSMKAWITPPNATKQFNQQYTSAHQTMAKLPGAQSAYSGEAPPKPEPVPPDDIDEDALRADLEAAKAELAKAANGTTAVRNAVNTGGKRMSVNVTNANNLTIAAVAAATKAVNAAMAKLPPE